MANQSIEIHTLKSIVGTASVSVSDAVAVLDETGLAPEDFAETGPRVLFGAIAAALRDGRQPDAVALLAVTRSKVPRELVVDVVTNAALGSARQRIELVREASARRRAGSALNALLQGVQNPGVSLSASLAEAQRVLAAFTEPTGGAKSQEGDLLEFIDVLEQVQLGQREPVLATGIEALDFMIGGLQRTLTIIGALPGVGKSALLASILRNLTARKVRVGLLSLEDTRRWVTSRLLSEASNVPVFVLGKKPLTDEQKARVDSAAPLVYDSLRYLLTDDTAAMTTAQVVASARRMVAMGCKAILVDHLGEIRLERTDRHDLDIADALQNLRAIAKVYGVPVVVACHLRRRDGLTPETAPRLSDFAFSAAVERMARVALGLYRVKDDSNLLGVSLLKQTEGPAGYEFNLNITKHSGTVAQTLTTRAMESEFHWSGK